MNSIYYVVSKDQANYLAHARTYSHKYIRKEPDGRGGYRYYYKTDVGGIPAKKKTLEWKPLTKDDYDPYAKITYDPETKTVNIHRDSDLKISADKAKNFAKNTVNKISEAANSAWDKGMKWNQHKKAESPSYGFGFKQRGKWKRVQEHVNEVHDRYTAESKEFQNKTEKIATNPNKSSAYAFQERKYYEKLEEERKNDRKVMNELDHKTQVLYSRYSQTPLGKIENGLKKGAEFVKNLFKKR